MKGGHLKTKLNSDLLRTALTHHESGKLREAEAIYSQILDADPSHFDALHLLGVIANQTGSSALAVELINKALRQNPENPFAHNNLGLALQAQAKMDEAAASYRQALSIKSDFADAHYNLGNVLQAQSKLVQAAASYCKALALQPNDAEACNNLGSTLRSLGELDEAIVNFRKALVFSPNYAEAFNNLGVTLQEQGEMDEAVACLRKALALKPDYVEAIYNLGKAFQSRGMLVEAVACYQKSLTLKPGHAEAYIALGNLFQEGGKLDEAVSSYNKALAIKPDYAEALYNLGKTFNSLGKQSEAVESCRKAIVLKPDYAEAYNNLGGALRNQGRLDEAINSIHMARSLKPDLSEIQSNLIFTMTYHPGYSPIEYLSEARRYGDMLGSQARPYTQWPFSSVGSNERSLRVGLVSGDLRGHPVGFFLENILAHLTPGRLELVAYVTNPREDLLTARIKPSFALWNHITGMSDEAVARKIYADGIQILIDMAGHTQHNRLSVFAWKPAPVQVSWLGYWASTGVPGMDFILVDRVSVPESHQAHFTEKIWYLPNTRLCFTPPADSSKIPPSPLPRMRNGYITFGCFQSLSKINDKVLALWSRVLFALPGARLRLQNIQMNCPESREQIQNKLSNFGITLERVTLEYYIPRESYLAAYADVDIVLDTFPFPGGTTTCEALWMGVPTLTLAGATLLGRQGASMLNCVGLEDWIAYTEEDFIAKAVFHTSDINRLAQVRAGLRQQVLGSPLFDGTGFAVHLENALQNMWQCSSMR